MKHLFNIITVLAIGWMAIGCGDKGYDVSETPTFTVREADVQYPAAGGSGTISLETHTPGTPKVTVDKSWCQATLSGNTINISVTGQADSYSREATLTISLGDYTRSIGLYQGGMYFYVANQEYGELGYSEGSVLRIPLIRDGDMAITTSNVPDWANATVIGNDLVITALSNNGWSKRGGIVTMTVGRQSKSAFFTQTEHPLDYNSYLGTWLMTSYSSSSIYQEHTLTFSALVEGKSYRVEGLLYPIVVDFVDGVISFYASQVCGSYTSGGVPYDVYIRIVNDASSSNSSSTAGMYSTYNIGENGQLVLTMLNNGVYAAGTGFGFYYTTPAGNYTRAKYRTEVKLYKQ